VLIKLYGQIGRGQFCHSPVQVIGRRYERIYGAPNAQYTSTSYAERQNLTMRMQMRAVRD
jgi:hypothetical protein